MNLNDWAAIGEIVGAIAVVVTLIYLAVQVRHSKEALDANTRAIRGSTLDAITQNQQTELRWSADTAHVWRKVLEDPESLTFEESWQASEWMTAALCARQNEYRQYRQGLLEEDVWESIQNVVRILLGVPWGRRWFDDYGHEVLTDDFVNVVKGILEDKSDLDARELLSDVVSFSGSDQ